MSSLASSSKAPDTREVAVRKDGDGDPRAYGYNNFRNHQPTTDFIAYHRAKETRAIRPLSIVLENLPFRSSILDSPLPLVDLLKSLQTGDYITEASMQNLMVSVIYLYSILACTLSSPAWPV